MTSQKEARGRPTRVEELAAADEGGCGAGDTTATSRAREQEESRGQSVGDAEDADDRLQQKTAPRNRARSLPPSVSTLWAKQGSTAGTMLAPARRASSALSMVGTPELMPMQAHADSPGSPHNTGGVRRAYSFLHFPAEIRNMIYSHLTQYPHCADLYRSFYRTVTYAPGGAASRPRRQALHTPTVLLLCKHITAECLPMLRARPLVIDRLPPFEGADTLPDRYHRGFLTISDFVGRRTIQSLRHIDIRIGLGEGPLGSGWAWKNIVDEVIQLLEQRNAFISMRLLIRLCNWTEQSPMGRAEYDIYKHIAKKMKYFAHMQSRISEQHRMALEVWRIEGEQAVFETSCHWHDVAGVWVKVLRTRGPALEEEFPACVRKYPDSEMFPGSIMDFVEPLPPPPSPPPPPAAVASPSSVGSDEEGQE